MRIDLLAAIATILLLASCTGNICSEKYLEFQKGRCCADLNQNLICDSDETPAMQNATAISAARSISVERIKETAAAAPNNASAYDLIATAMNKSCLFYTATTSRRLENGSWYESLSWQPFPGALCNTKQDCIDYVDNVLIPVAQKQNLPESEVEKIRNMYISQGVRCE